MRRKRKVGRRKLRAAPCLWLLLIVNIGLGICFSRITSIVRVRTEGVKVFDQARIEGILAGLKDIPCLRVDSHVVESEVMAGPDIDNAEFTRNVFGNALLSVRYRTPVAKLGDNGSEALGPDGVLFHASELPPDLPELDLPNSGPPTLAALAGNWQPRSLATLAIYARNHYPRAETKIEVDRRGAVCLNIGSGRVVLGSCDDLDLKLKTLESRLQRNPQELDQVEELNLTTPSMPAVVPKKPGKRH